jgi:hypothetical protein
MEVTDQSGYQIGLVLGSGLSAFISVAIIMLLITRVCLVSLHPIKFGLKLGERRLLITDLIVGFLLGRFLITANTKNVMYPALGESGFALVVSVTVVVIAAIDLYLLKKQKPKGI